ncbi:MAG: dTDP-4-dehydrorhamnose reductase [Gemmatimonadales bacterium]|nr:dTDP-4-dehydrorhamnose reductase [Gemmatimonadales bacterium]
MKILVTGCKGMLGRDCMDYLAVAQEPVGVDLEDGDLALAGIAEDICQRVDPQWIVHCAAWTDVDGAESAPDQAHSANVTATENLAGWCGRSGCGLTYISTDYVFSGADAGGGYDEEEPRDPVNRYGLTKAQGEEIVAALSTPWQIVRTSWLFGDGPVNFPRTILRLLSQRESLSVVNDQEGCPTFTRDLAHVIGFLVHRGLGGIFHATNSGVCTWYDLAREVAVLTGSDPDRIQPCGSDVYPRPAVRPNCSVLRSRRLEEAGCPARPGWQDALARYLPLLTSGRSRFQ